MLYFSGGTSGGSVPLLSYHQPLPVVDGTVGGAEVGGDGFLGHQGPGAGATTRGGASDAPGRVARMLESLWGELRAWQPSIGGHQWARLGLGALQQLCGRLLGLGRPGASPSQHGGAGQLDGTDGTAGPEHVQVRVVLGPGSTGAMDSGPLVAVAREGEKPPEPEPSEAEVRDWLEDWGLTAAIDEQHWVRAYKALHKLKFGARVTRE